MFRKHVPSFVAISACSALVGAMVAGGAGSATAQAQPGTSKATATWAPGGKRERLTPENCVIALIDHQTGLTNLVENTTAVTYKNYCIGLAKTAKIHNVPVVLTTSAADGPNGPFLPEILEILPDAPMIARPGQINAWDNADFVDAIKKTGRKKIVMSGITTDVCVAFAALSALDAGFEVYVVADASGSMSPEVQGAALMRMSDAGAIIGTWFALSCELLSDWRNPAGQATAQLFVEHFPSYAEIYYSHKAHAKAAGTKK
jgi:nicotinamidase-related amidase